MLGVKTLTASGWSFMSHDKRRVVYSTDALPKSAAIMDRLLVFQVPIKMSEQRLSLICVALAKAAIEV